MINSPISSDVAMRIVNGLDTSIDPVYHAASTYAEQPPIAGWEGSRPQTPRDFARQRYYNRRALIVRVHREMLDEQAD